MDGEGYRVPEEGSFYEVLASLLRSDMRRLEEKFDGLVSRIVTREEMERLYAQLASFLARSEFDQRNQWTTEKISGLQRHFNEERSEAQKEREYMSSRIAALEDRQIPSWIVGVIAVLGPLASALFVHYWH